MRLEKASYKAIKYACMNFHYAKAIPVNTFGYSVFNDKNEWCGVVLYGSGASANIGKPYGLGQGEVIELVRMALNGKQESTSKVLSLSLRFISKYIPLCKLIVSYADLDQCHYGTIYQATNWYYTGLTSNDERSGWIINGKKWHRKSIYGKLGTDRKEIVLKHFPSAKEWISKGKHKYIYPLNKSYIHIFKSLSKPYPKKEQQADKA